MEYPLIFDIKRHAVEDGPGIRTTVFFKGCNLKCAWCHNPEAIEPTVEVGFYPSLCINCKECERACRFENVCSLDNPGLIDRARCVKCGDCVRVCPSEALKFIGKYYSEEELVEVLLRDKTFYEVSGGGITFSGGEPTLFANYLSSVLLRLKAEGIHTAIQTNGNFEWSKFQSLLLGVVDLVMIDIKLADADEHLRLTGKSNKVILENLERLVKCKNISLMTRIPLVPNVTATEKNLVAVKKILNKLGVINIECLPYNPMGLAKWENIGKEVPFNLSTHMMSAQEEEHCRKICR